MSSSTGAEGPPGDDEGSDPDPRFSYANERTFLAWNRTALALMATGVAATALLPELAMAGGRQLIGIPLIVLGGFLAVASYRRWRANERAMRLRRPLPRSLLPLLLACGVGLSALTAAIVAAVGAR
jgi:putative membrane protein